MKRLTFSTGLGVSALGLCAALALSGCAETDDSALQELTESILDTTTDSEVEIDENSVYIASPDGGGIAATVDPGQNFSATWRMEEGNPDYADSYVEQWEMMGFERDGFLDMASNSHRVLTYRLIGPDMEVGVSATISEGEDDSLISIAGSWK